MAKNHHSGSFQNVPGQSSQPTRLAGLRATISILSLCGLLAACESLTPQLGKPANLPDGYLVPAISGSLLQGSGRAAGRVLLLSLNEGRRGRCERPLAEATSDSDGKFSFEVIGRDLEIGNTLERLENNWQICLQGDSEPKAQMIWFDSHAGVQFGDALTVLSCDLDKLGQGNRLACKPI